MRGKGNDLTMTNSSRHRIKRLKSEDRTEIKRCHLCLQILNDSKLALFGGPPEGAKNELVALRNSKLSIFIGEEASVKEDDQRPMHKLTSFSIYDKECHLCPFDAGLIERNVPLYMSGFMKAIYDENESTEGGVASRDLGPITEWWISGFDGGQTVVIGFSTQFADYILMAPSESYSPYFETAKEKIYLSKFVIEYLLETPGMEYEHLVNKLTTSAHLPGIAEFSEETLLKHAQFVADQVHSYDLAGIDDVDDPLIIAPCMRHLLGLTGLRLSRGRAMGLQNMKTTNLHKYSRAVTTPFIQKLFKSVFANQMHNSNEFQALCGMCESCLQPDCGDCIGCINMGAFSTEDWEKQSCINRRCTNVAMANDEEIINGTTMSTPEAPKKHELAWIGDHVLEEGSKRAYYLQLSVDGEVVTVGDCVEVIKVQDSKSLNYLSRVVSMWENDQQLKYFHAHWFCWGRDTILGEIANPKEIFLIDSCDDVPLSALSRKISVIEHHASSDWAMRGGIQNPLPKLSSDTFFYQKLYNPEFARFEDIPDAPKLNNVPVYESCLSCYRMRMSALFEMCQLGPKLKENGQFSQNFYKSVKYRGCTYAVGDCVFVNPGAFRFKSAPFIDDVKTVKCDGVDEDLYPEYYRKNAESTCHSSCNTPEPFRVVRILRIYTKNSGFCSVLSPGDVKLRVAKFYRPENTHQGMEATRHLDLNVLYWNNEEATLTYHNILGKCWVVFKENLSSAVDEYTVGGPYRFYFSLAYDAKTESFENPPKDALAYKSCGMNDGTCKEGGREKILSMEEYPKAERALRCLDAFAGCGGLSLGLSQSGVCKPHWSIEVSKSAAQAYKLNHPNTTVFIDDCNNFLKLVMEGRETNSVGQKLPQKGDVELLCGGPPCQGYSPLNRYQSSFSSQFKNCLVVSLLSFCDFYRPKFFLMENVLNFVLYERSMVLKVTLQALLSIGYQCTVGILQAGNYGVPQTRRRAFILAAAPGQKLPNYPEPLTTFSFDAGSLSCLVDQQKYVTNCRWISSAPLRTITVRDALSDLPPITVGLTDKISYHSEPKSHFQRLIRDGEGLLRDHVCQELSPLNEARIGHIPTIPGADWRDLPNISVQLNDGTFSNILNYTHDDKKNGRSSTGAFRGVCSCASGAPCDPECRQLRTLIPWWLPHTSNRHNHFSGIYGRLEWDGYFSTVVTVLEPLRKQGRVLHPEQNRVLSVRECARSQGFPDFYRFYGTELDRYCQIGNAVPPPVGKAIGLEILKVL